MITVVTLYVRFVLTSVELSRPPVRPPLHHHHHHPNTHPPTHPPPPPLPRTHRRRRCPCRLVGAHQLRLAHGSVAVGSGSLPRSPPRSLGLSLAPLGSHSLARWLAGSVISSLPPALPPSLTSSLTHSLTHSHTTRTGLPMAARPRAWAHVRGPARQAPQRAARARPC